MTFLTMMLAAVAVAAQADRSMTGTWSLETEVMGYAGSAVCALVQEGNKITGKCASEGVDRPVTGEISSGKYSFQHASEYEGQALTIVYAGTLESDTALAGSMTVQPFDVAGTFKAKKQEQGQPQQQAPAAGPAQAQGQSLTGHWLIHLNIIGRQGDQDCTFTQKGNELTGTCKSYEAAGDIEGTVDGNNVKWLLKRDTGSTGNLNFFGTVGADGNIKGTVDVPSYTVSGAFTATRAPGGQSQPQAN